MSASLMEWAADQRGLTAAQFRVLLVLAKRANGDRTCFPSMQRLADDCELTKQTVVAAVLFLRDAKKLIKIVADREERAAILAKARARLSAQVHVYRVGPSDEDETATPSQGKTGQIDIPVSPESYPQPHHTGQNNSPVLAPTGQTDRPVTSATGQKNHSRPVKNIIKTGQANGPESSKESRKETKSEASEQSSDLGNEAPLADIEAVSPAQRLAVQTMLGKVKRSLSHREYAPGRAPALTPQEQIATATSQAASLKPHPGVADVVMAARAAARQRVAA